MKKFFFDCGTRDSLASAGLFILRISFGLMMLLGHGIGKIQKFDQLKDSWYVPDFIPLKWMSPPVSLIATIVAEVAVPILLILGIATRPAAFVLAFTMVIITVDIHQSEPWFLSRTVKEAKELSLLYLMPMLVLIVTGAGSWSADAALYQEKRRKIW